jgi:hypothetical protein
MLPAADLYEIDSILDRAVRECHPRSWDENHITYAWLATLRREWPHLSKRIHAATLVRWDAYKMSGRAEQQNGDVAFVIDMRFPNGNALAGVGFLEAKRIFDTDRFDSLKWIQLRTLAAGSSYHQLLLYDHTPLAVPFSMDGLCCCADECMYAEYCNCTHIDPPGPSAAIVVPSAHALALEKKSRDLETLGTPLAEQIVLRYFRGLDIDFDETLVQRVLSGIPGGPDFLAVASVAVGWKPDKLIEVQPPRMPSERSGFYLIEGEPDIRR